MGSRTPRGFRRSFLAFTVQKKQNKDFLPVRPCLLSQRVDLCDPCKLTWFGGRVAVALAVGAQPPSQLRVLPLELSAGRSGDETRSKSDDFSAAGVCVRVCFGDV